MGCWRGKPLAETGFARVLLCRLSQSLASSTSPSRCASFLCVDIFFPFAGASHGRSLLRPLVGAKIGGAPGGSILRRILFTVCLSRWLHQQACLVAHLFCVLIFFPVCRRLSRTRSPAPPRRRKNCRCSGGIVLAPHLVYRLSQSLASSIRPSRCASFLCVDIFFPSAGASHRRSLLRPLVRENMGGALGESFWRRISSTVCLSRWLHR